MSGVDGGGVVVPHPASGQPVDLFQSARFLHQLQATFKLTLDDVVGLLDLALSSCVTDFVDDQLDAQGATQVAEHRGGHGRTGVGHDHEGHAMERIGITALDHRADQYMAEVLRAFSAEHVMHVQGTAGVVRDDVTP